jgi:hypothetical protein
LNHGSENNLALGLRASQRTERGDVSIRPCRRFGNAAGLGIAAGLGKVRIACQPDKTKEDLTQASPRHPQPNLRADTDARERCRDALDFDGPAGKHTGTGQACPKTPNASAFADGAGSKPRTDIVATTCTIAMHRSSSSCPSPQ